MDQPNGFVLDNSDPCPIDPENDSDGDSICESDEVFGCTDEIACNYNIDATEEDDSCAYVVNSCDSCENGIVVTMILTVMEFVMLMKFQAVLIFLMLNTTQKQRTMMVLVQYFPHLDVLMMRRVILFPELQKMMVLVPP